jgi:hypothetical protein
MMMTYDNEEDRMLRALLAQTTPRPDPARLADLRRAILAQTPVQAPAAQRGKRWWLWGFTAGAALAGLLLGFLVMSETPVPTPQAPAAIARTESSLHQAARVKQDYMALFDDPHEALFEWEDYTGSGMDPLGLTHDEGLDALF